MQKYPTLDLKTIERLVDMLGGMDGLEALEKGDLMIAPKSREHIEGRDIEYLSVTSDGTSWSQWEERLKSRGIVIWPTAEESLRQDPTKFETTKGVTSNLVILKRDLLFMYLGRNERVASMVARQCGWLPPSIEVACLLCEQLSLNGLQKLGISCGLSVMHRPIKYPQGRRMRFSFGRDPMYAGPNLLFSAHDVSGDVLQAHSLHHGYVFALSDSVPRS